MFETVLALRRTEGFDLKTIVHALDFCRCLSHLPCESWAGFHCTRREAGAVASNVFGTACLVRNARVGGGRFRRAWIFIAHSFVV